MQEKRSHYTCAGRQKGPQLVKQSEIDVIAKHSMRWTRRGRMINETTLHLSHYFLQNLDTSAPQRPLKPGFHYAMSLSRYICLRTRYLKASNLEGCFKPTKFGPSGIWLQKRRQKLTLKWLYLCFRGSDDTVQTTNTCQYLPFSPMVFKLREASFRTPEAIFGAWTKYSTHS